MNEITKLILSINQVNNVINLIDGNEYEDYMKSQLISVSVELQRQLTCLQHSNKLNTDALIR